MIFFPTPNDMGTLPSGPPSPPPNEVPPRDAPTIWIYGFTGKHQGKVVGAIPPKNKRVREKGTIWGYRWADG